MFGLLYEQNSITRSYQLIWMIVCLLVSGQSMLDAAEKMPLADDSAKRKVYFTTDVVPLLTRLNCNSGGCHGKSTGQNGFKISLLGFDPAMDYSAIARESRGRRIFPGDPDRSLLLLKATGLVPHGGGRLLEADSADYALLYDWIEQGAIGPHPDDPKINKIELSPGNRVFQQRSSLQLRVTAYFSDGTQRDVTHQSIYESNYPEIGKVDQEGLITTQSRGGVFAVMARFGEKIAVFQGVVPYHSKGQQKLTGYPSEEQLSKIDQRLVAQWKKLGILPSKPVDDATFIRRVTLDICGTLPTVDEVRQYLADSRADKRERLIDRLLERPEYASYFALKWADILQNRGSGYGTRNQRAGTMLFSAWIRDSIVANKPYDRFVTELLTATGRQAQNPPAIWYRSVRSTPDYVESVAQAF